MAHAELVQVRQERGGEEDRDNNMACLLCYMARLALRASVFRVLHIVQPYCDYGSHRRVCDTKRGSRVLCLILSQCFEISTSKFVLPSSLWGQSQRWEVGQGDRGRLYLHIV